MSDPYCSAIVKGLSKKLHKLVMNKLSLELSDKVIKTSHKDKDYRAIIILQNY